MKTVRFKRIPLYGIAFGFIHRKKNWGKKEKYIHTNPPLLITNYFLFDWSIEFCPYEAYLLNYVRFMIYCKLTQFFDSIQPYV